MSDPDAVLQRQTWMRVLALSPVAALETAWETLTDKPACRPLRPPQIGSVMIRGRAGGTGEPFNLGELTMTRAAVQIAAEGGSRLTGYGHVAGRCPRHAELAALFDALLQDPVRRPALLDGIIEPLAAGVAARQAERHARTVPSRVEFFTMVRGS